MSLFSLAIAKRNSFLLPLIRIILYMILLVLSVNREGLPALVEFWKAESCHPGRWAAPESPLRKSVKLEV